MVVKRLLLLLYSRSFAENKVLNFSDFGLRLKFMPLVSAKDKVTQCTLFVIVDNVSYGHSDVDERKHFAVLLNISSK